VAAAASTGPFPERAELTSLLTVDLGWVASRRVDRRRGLALLRDEDFVRPALLRARR
jgi:hypothetical protein